MTSFKIFLFSFLVSYLATPLFIRVAGWFNFLDYPTKERSIHKRPMPILGGLVISIAFFLSVILLIKDRDFRLPAKGLLLGSLIILITGLIDDKKGLSATLRLLIQLLASILVIKFGIVLTFLPNNWLGLSGEWILTIIWIIGITNALNCLDGLDGLATGLAVITSICFFVVCYLTSQLQLAAICLALAGGCLGLLRYNFHPAKIFLGNSGSTFLGFILACIAIMGNWAQDNVVAITVPILILGVPIFDMTFTTIARVYTKKIKNIIEWFEYAALDHFHHRLVELGLHFRGAVLFIYSISLILGLSAVVLWQDPGFDAIMLLIQAGLVFAVISVLMVIGKRRKSVWDIEDRGTNRH
ncbi:MAG: MraY family glycosyltransferase [Candidatus Omnitrophota bacterium]